MSAAANEDDKALLDTLTPEEREAMAEEMTEDEKTALAAVANDDEGDDDDAAAGDDDETEAGEDEGAQAAAAPDAKPDVSRREPAKAPLYHAELPADFTEQEAAIKAKRDDLAARFKAGDIDFDEYRAEDAGLAAEERALDRAITKSEISAETREQAFAAEWKANVIAFTDDVKKAGDIDYRADTVAQQKLDGFVTALFNDPDNANMTMREVLDNAHAMVKLVYKPAAGKPDAGTDKPAAKPASRKADLSGLPKTLAHVPGGEGPGDVGGGEFGDLDGLDGLELEQAIARMTPAQREKFASMAG